MNIRRKLIVLSSIVLLSSVVVIGYLSWSTFVALRQIEKAELAVIDLQRASNLRRLINAQMQEAMEYLLTGRKEDRDTFNATKAMAIKALAEWKEGEIEGSEYSSLASEHMNNAQQIGITYTKVMELFDQAFALAEDGNQQEARRIIDGTAEWIIEGKLFKIVDETIHEEIDGVDKSYDRLLVSMGSVPWQSEKSLLLVHRARHTIDYYLVIDKVNLGVTRESKEIVDYLVSSGDGDHENLLRYSAGVVTAFDDWLVIVEHQKAEGIEGEDDDLSAQIETQNAWLETKTVIDRIVSLKDRQTPKETYALALAKLDYAVNTKLTPRIEESLADANREIAEAHEILFKQTLYTGIYGAGIFVGIAIMLSLLTLTLTRNMAGSLEKLQVGVNNIAFGNLNHRIDIDSADEWGALAASFNRMTEEIARSRNALMAAKEESEQHACEMEQMNNELGNFTFIFFHDLRTPIVNLRGFVGELRNSLKDVTALMARSMECLEEEERTKLANALHKEIPEALLFIDNAVYRMNNLMNGIVTLSRYGNRELKPETIDSKKLVQQIIVDMQDEIETHLATVKVGELPTVVADCHALKLIFHHILENAIRYLLPEREGLIMVDCDKGEKGTVFRISDNGRGISGEDQTKIFDIFKRAGAQDVPGEGMGLPYVKTLVRRHGGRIWCESELGVGTTFFFTLPKSEEQQIR